MYPSVSFQSWVDIKSKLKIQTKYMPAFMNLSDV